MVGYGGGSTGLTNTSASAAERIGDRGIAMGGYASSADSNIIQYVNIAAGSGNMSDFGDLPYSARWVNACAGSGYGFCVGGMGSFNPAEINNISRITISTTGNAVDHGDLTEISSWCAATSNGAKGFRSGGSGIGAGNYQNTIDTWDCTNTAANATDFGDLSHVTRYNEMESDGSRGLSIGGLSSQGQASNDIEHFDTASAGNATDTRNLTTSHTNGFATGCDGTTVICMGGTHGSGSHETCDYFTVQSNSDASDWGDLTSARDYNRGASSEDRLLSLGGNETGGGGTTNNINAVVYSTQGNAVDWGNMTSSIARMGGCSGN